MIWPRSKIDENNGALITHRRAPSENLAPVLLASSPAVGRIHCMLGINLPKIFVNDAH